MCSEQDPLSHIKRLKMGIFAFLSKETGAKSVAMALCHYVSFVMYIAGAKFEEYCLNSLELFLIECQ